MTRVSRLQFQRDANNLLCASGRFYGWRLFQVLCYQEKRADVAKPHKNDQKGTPDKAVKDVTVILRGNFSLYLWKKCLACMFKIVKSSLENVLKSLAFVTFIYFVFLRVKIVIRIKRSDMMWELVTRLAYLSLRSLKWCEDTLWSVLLQSFKWAKTGPEFQSFHKITGNFSCRRKILSHRL